MFDKVMYAIRTKDVGLTSHANQRITERNIPFTLVVKKLATGNTSFVKSFVSDIDGSENCMASVKINGQDICSVFTKNKFSGKSWVLKTIYYYKPEHYSNRWS